MMPASLTVILLSFFPKFSKVPAKAHPTKLGMAKYMCDTMASQPTGGPFALLPRALLHGRELAAPNTPLFGIECFPRGISGA